MTLYRSEHHRLQTTFDPKDVEPGYIFGGDKVWTVVREKKYRERRPVRP